MSDGMTDTRSQLIYGDEYVKPATVDRIALAVRNEVARHMIGHANFQSMTVGEANAFLNVVFNKVQEALITNVEVHHE